MRGLELRGFVFCRMFVVLDGVVSFMVILDFVVVVFMDFIVFVC